jgi:phospholipid/cholesterol/gamma-HCH transport system substrate-binding protein
MNLKSGATFVVFTAMILAFVMYISSLGIRVSPSDHPTKLSMDVADINNLTVDSNVLLRGAPVGKVSQIDTSLHSATIHFYVEEAYAIPLNSVVRLENLSALGESYIEIEPRESGGQVYASGQQISTSDIKAPSSISELGTSVVRVMNQMDPGQLQNVIGEADDALPDPYAVLPNLARASVMIRNTVRDMHGAGRQVLDNSQSLLENADFLGPTLAESATGLRDLGLPLQRLWNLGVAITLRNDTPGNVFVFGKFLARIQKFLDDRGPDVRALTEPLTANIQAIAAALQTIDTSQVLTNLLSAVPEDGAINLHVTTPEAAPGEASPDAPSGGEPSVGGGG